MKTYLRRFSLTTINLVGIIILFLFVILFAFIVIYEEYHDFQSESDLLRQNYYKVQKLRAKDETLKVLTYIDHFYHKMHTQMSEEKLKESIVSSIEDLFDRKNGSSYIFIYTNEGVNISDPNKPYNRGKNLIEFQDPNGKYVLKELIEKAKKGGGYVEYMWDNPITKALSPKISYAMTFNEWGWMIGTGVYLDEIDKIIAEKRSKYKDRLSKYILEILVLVTLLFLFAFGVINVIGKTIRRETNAFREFFQQSVQHNIVIDKNQIKIKEFQILAEYVNEMVWAIHQKNSELKTLNMSLEEKVLQKTARLQEQMAYNVQLVADQDSFIKHSIHEINTPLAVILTHIDIYKMKYGENEYLSKIEAASKMISNIYDDLGYMVKKDRVNYVKTKIDFPKFLHERIAFFEEIAAGNGYEIICNAGEGIIVDFNDVELQRIIDNNLSNAIKYAKRSTKIRVKLYKENQEAVLMFITCSKKIEDTKLIFEAFHQEEKRVGGFGLGLEIVGSICRKENVKIEVESNEDFTTFTYRFKLGVEL